MISLRIVRNCIAVTMVVLLAAGGAWANSSRRRSAAPEQQRSAGPAGDRVLQMLPARSLFCVRINNFDGTLGQVDQFLDGVAPDAFDGKAMLLSKLSHLIGKDQLSSVRTKGQFILFGVNLPGKRAKKGPKESMFVGTLIPVKKYDAFVSNNPNCGEPDDKGISKITIDGKTRCLVTQCRRFALLCSPEAQDKLARVKRLLRARMGGLTGTLDQGDIDLATNSPIWLYANVEQASELISPIIFGKLEQMKTAIKKAQESGAGMMGDPEGIVKFYRGVLSMLMDETSHITVGLSPGSNVCNVTFATAAVPETDLAKILGTSVESGDYKKLLGYLEGGAIINFACKVDHKVWKTSYARLFDFFARMTDDAVNQADIAKLRKLTAKSLDAMGDSLAFSFTAGSGSTGPFSMKEIIEVGDEKLFAEMLEEQLQMMDEGAFSRLYKGFGLEVDFKAKRDVDTYKGVKIDSAKLSFKTAERNSPQEQMVKKMWGEALEWRWAILDDYCVYAMGANADKTIRELIDQVKAGGPKTVGSEMQAALRAIPDSDKADVVGTFNYVDMLRMALAAMPMPSDAALPQPSSQSSIAFAGSSADGKMTLQIALPKQHLVEIKSAVETLERQVKKSQEQHKK